jgi:hypothetical protein
MAATLQRSSDLTAVSIGSIPPWIALLVALAGVFGIPTLVKWMQEGTWRGGLYVDPHRSPWLDLLLAFSVTAAVFVARDTHASGVWYTTIWWHLACLVAVLAVAVAWWKVRARHVRHVLITGGEPRHARNAAYVILAGWTVALVPVIVLTGPVWARPINIVVLLALFGLSVFGQRLIRWANHMDDHIDALEVRLHTRRAPA